MDFQEVAVRTQEEVKRDFRKTKIYFNLHFINALLIPAIYSLLTLELTNTKGVVI